MPHVHLAHVPRHVRGRPRDLQPLLDAAALDGVDVVDPDRHPHALVAALVPLGAECHQRVALAPPALPVLAEEDLAVAGRDGAERRRGAPLPPLLPAELLEPREALPDARDVQDRVDFLRLHRCIVRRAMSKTVLITGGSRGIGRVTAMRLLADGWAVAFTYSKSKEAAVAFQEEARATLDDDAPIIEAFAADVRDDANNHALVERVLARFGSLDALVNNAGIRYDALLYTMTPAQFHEVVETNLFGAWSMSKAVLPHFVRQRRGAIVNVASLSGMHGVVGQTHYSGAHR